MQERRVEVRMLSADMVTIRWKDKKGQAQTVTGLLEDISTSGACLQLEAPVPLDTQIEWSTPKQKFTGHVRYCVYREIGYFVGLEFDPKSRWSKKVYRPRHLLDLRRLVG
jgi:PilZ domain